MGRFLTAETNTLPLRTDIAVNAERFLCPISSYANLVDIDKSRNLNLVDIDKSHNLNLVDIDKLLRVVVNQALFKDTYRTPTKENAPFYG